MSIFSRLSSLSRLSHLSRLSCLSRLSRLSCLSCLSCVSGEGLQYWEKASWLICKKFMMYSEQAQKLVQVDALDLSL